MAGASQGFPRAESGNGSNGGPSLGAGEAHSPKLTKKDVPDESALAGLCGALGAAGVAGLCERESGLLETGTAPRPSVIEHARRLIWAGKDPLGEAFCALRSAAARRTAGAVYTPEPIVSAMLAWAQTQPPPVRVLDPGAGSARFLVGAGRRFPEASLVAVESDPLAALTARANLAASGMAGRSRVQVESFLDTAPAGRAGRTLFIGNPPYIRHHLISPVRKRWLKEEAAALGVRASALAGLHAYFFLAVARIGRPGDYGALITSAEWLDVNYGRLVRELFVGRLGGQSVLIVEPRAEPFPGTASTGAITTFEVGSSPKKARFARAARVSAIGELGAGSEVARRRLIREVRWSDFTRTLPKPPEGFIELGEICRVHRGQVTGANRVWIAGPHSAGLPERVLFPAVTKARELFDCGLTLSEDGQLRRVIDLPTDLAGLAEAELESIREFLGRAEEMGANLGYVARHRRSWWSVGLRTPAPILATYMARRPPAFVLNRASARHLNVAHGLYPRERLPENVLVRLVKWLRRSATLDGGRVYAGGLTKFEPGEMERIRVPSPANLMRDGE